MPKRTPQDWETLEGELHAAGVSAEEIEAGARELLAQARGHQLAEARKQLGLAQRDIAIAMEVSVARVSQIEHGEVTSFEVIARYVEALGGRLDLVADFGEADVGRLLGDAGIVRHRGKIEAAIANAQATVALRRDGEPLQELFWSHAPGPRPAAATPSPLSLRLELHVLVRRRVCVVGDQPQAALGHARALTAEEGQFPDRGIHDLVVQELLDAVKHLLALLPVEDAALLAHEPLDVRIASVHVGPPGGHEGIDARGRGAV